MKILLIKPSYFKPNGKLYKIKRIIRPELTLSLLAALTPPDIEVEINDETIEDIDFNTDAELIGITSLTRNIKRAYQIAEEFRRKEKTVVMGGMHVTFMPDEASNHCNTVVIGEAEDKWSELISDYRKGKLNKFYKNTNLHSLDDIPSPRFDLLNLKKYKIKIIPVQATRGCKHGCEFCSVTQFFNGRIRSRPIKDVLRDIQLAQKMGSKWIFFVDENIIADREYAKELFRSLIPLNIKWMGQSTIQIADDPELLDLAANSGCTFLEIGFESINVKNLKNCGKRVDHINEYVEGIKMLRQKKFIIGASLIFGFDSDDINIFYETLNFLEANKIPIFDSYILTPGPGTKLFERFEKEGRITHSDWQKYNGKEIVFKPNLMTSEELRFNFWKMAKTFYSLKNIFRRIFQVPLRNLIIIFYLNIKNWVNLGIKRTI